MPLNRDLMLLEVLTSPEAQRRGSLGVARVAAITGLDQSVVSRALRALEAEGVVVRDAVSKGYSLGWRLPMLVAPTAVSAVMRLADGVMRELATTFPDGIQSVVFLRNNRVFLPYNLSGGRVFPDEPWSGKGRPAFCTAPGRALLSDRTPTELRRMYPDGLPLEEAPHCTVRTVDDLVKVVQRARADGYAATDGQYQPGVVGAAAPLRDQAGTIVAALNVTFTHLPTTQPERQTELEAAGRTIARTVNSASKRLGWIPFPIA